MNRINEKIILSLFFSSWNTSKSTEPAMPLTHPHQWQTAHSTHSPLLLRKVNSRSLFSTCCWGSLRHTQMHQHLCWAQRNLPEPQRFASVLLLALQPWPGTCCCADSPPWPTSLSPVRHISLVARENMVTGFFPSTCLMIGSCPTRPSSWTRFMAETRETKHTGELWCF